MALVVLRPDTSAPFLLDFTRQAAANGTLRLDFVVRHPVTRAIATSLVSVHERPAHLFVVSSDLEKFEHLHPEPQPDGRLELIWTPPSAGRYHLFLDIVPAGALPQLLEAVVQMPGPNVSAGAAASMTATRDGVQASLEAGEFVAGQWSRLVFKLSDATSGAALDGWEPWLGAWAHIFSIRDGATEPHHAHPDEHDAVRDGPITSVGLDILFPRSGRFGVWVQIQRKGAVVTLPFRVEVLPATGR